MTVSRGVPQESGDIVLLRPRARHDPPHRILPHPDHIPGEECFLVPFDESSRYIALALGFCRADQSTFPAQEGWRRSVQPERGKSRLLLRRTRCCRS